MIRTALIMAILAIFPMIYSCATAPKTLVREDPLIGKIIDPASQTPILFDQLMEKIIDQDVVYLSEKHDNPMHHAIQHRIIQELIDQGRSPAIGFEFFPMDATPLLLNFVDSAKAGHSKKMDAAIEMQMRKKLGWEDQSDTMWRFYYDLLVLARDNGLTIAGLDLSTSQKRRITRKGLADLTSIEKQLLFSTNLTDPEYEAHMKSIFTSVHCGMGSSRMTARLYDTWKARNDKMALSISQLLISKELDAKQKTDTPGPIIIIMGNGHTEYGLGVIDRVAHLDPKISQLNIGITEITGEPSELGAYLDLLDLAGYAPVPPADYLWFTQRVSYGDPCQEFKASLQKMKKSSAKP